MLWLLVVVFVYRFFIGVFFFLFFVVNGFLFVYLPFVYLFLWWLELVLRTLVLHLVYGIMISIWSFDTGLFVVRVMVSAIETMVFD